MCKETLHNLISMYYDNIHNDVMLKTIAFRAVEEAVNSNHIQDIIDLSNSDIFSEKFKKYLLKGLCFSTNLADPICIDLILKKKVNFEEIELDRLKCIIDSFNFFKQKYSDSFDSIKNTVQEYVLDMSIKEGNYQYVKNFITNEKDNYGLRSKYLIKIKDLIPKEDFKIMNQLIQEGMFNDLKPSSKKKPVPRNLMNNYL
jgi:hypothetical protein